MNCHGNHDQEDAAQDKNGHGDHNSGIGHMLMMLLCCGLPILIVALLPLLRGIPGIDRLAKYSFLLCPIMMIPMMFMMGNKARTKRRQPREDEAVEHQHGAG